MNDRCHYCGGVVGRKHLPDCRANKPVSAEQGDVEVIREALTYKPQGTDPWTTEKALIALDRLLAALERAERERDKQISGRVAAHLLRSEARAEKAERALGEAVAVLHRYADEQNWLNYREYRIVPGTHGRDAAALAIAGIALTIDAFALRPEDSA